MSIGNAQNLFQSSYGGINSDMAVSVSFFHNGNAVSLSTTNSFNGNNDLLLSKIDEEGNTLWSKTYGGGLSETAVHLERTSDNGFILLGNTTSFGEGNEDIYIVKTDSIGNIAWSKTYGGSQGDFSGCVKEIPGGGYVIAGRTQSYGEGSDDGYLLKVDSNGDVLWSRSYGTSNNERFYYVDNTNDGGFIISGIQKYQSNYFDKLVIKVDGSGSIIFSKNFGDANGVGNDAGDCIKQTIDGGYILSGQYRAFGSGGEDLGLTKIDASGNVQWSKVYGNIGDDRAFDIAIDDFGNYILAGYTNSFGLGGFDGFLIKVDQLGSPIWYKTYGYAADDYFSEIEIGPSGYIIAGYTNSFGIGGQDIFIVKTDFEGFDNISCNNINVIHNYIFPIETDVIQIIHINGISNDPLTITQNVIVDKTDLLALNLPTVDSVYFQGDYEVPLDGIPAIGTFKIDGISSSSFIPSVLGNHLLKYDYEVLPGCIYTYEKNITVVDICKYAIQDLPLQCSISDRYICVSLVATTNIGSGVMGIDYCLKYDPDIMMPSGGYTLGETVTHGNADWATATITSIESDKIGISINYTINAPLKTRFNGSGEVICVEFELIETNFINSKYDVSVCNLNEFHDSYEVSTCGKSGDVFLSGDLQINGSVVYKEESSRIIDYIIDTKSSIDVIVKDISDSILNVIELDQFSDFEIVSGLNNKLFFNVILGELTPPHHLLKYRNGFDAYQMENIITNKINAPLQIDPSPYAIIAADVDLSDKIRANDISLLQELIVKKREGFPQQLPAEMNKEYLDWRFIDQRTVDREDGFKKASQYPYYSPEGYCRDNVPDVPFYLSDQGSCDESFQETYHAILLGDLVEGGSGVNLGKFTSDNSSYVTLDIDDVHDIGNHTYRVFFNHRLDPQDQFVSFDFTLDYDEATVAIVNTKMTVEDNRAVPHWLSNNYHQKELLFTSYSGSGYPLTGKLLYVDVQKFSGVPTIADLGQLHVFVNGSEVPASIRLRSQTSTGIDISKDVSEFVTIYPNPTEGQLTISLPLAYSKDVSVEFLNTIGQSVLTFTNEQANADIELDISTLPAGLYQCLITIEGKATVMKKVVLK
ncbi:MAG: hypothetical protein K0R51_2371 [Cytophagaceae bacterium]|nr:hypothetical protein [Cytophagaceae bacterium]